MTKSKVSGKKDLDKSFQSWRIKRQRLQKKVDELLNKGWQGSPDWYKNRGFKKKRREGETKATKIRREVGRWLSLKGILKELKKPTIVDWFPPDNSGILYVIVYYEKKGGKRYTVRNEWAIADYIMTDANNDKYDNEEFKKAIADMIENAEDWIEEKETIGFFVEETNIDEWKAKLDNDN